MSRCQRCEGIGWLCRLVPGVAGGSVTETKACPTCKGTGKITVLLIADAKMAAAGERDDEPTIAKDFPSWARA